MTAAWASKTELVQATVAQNWVLAKPSGVVAGDLLIATLRSDEDAITLTTPPSGWTLLHAFVGTGTNIVRVEVWWKVAGGSEPADYTFGWSTGTSNNGAATLERYTGAHPTSPIGAEDIFDFAEPLQSDSITPDVANCLIVSHISTDGGAAHVSPAFSPEVGWTERYDFEGTTGDVLVAGADVAQGAAAPISILWTDVNPVAVTIGIFAIRPAPAAGGASYAQVIA